VRFLDVVVTGGGRMRAGMASWLQSFWSEHRLGFGRRCLDAWMSTLGFRSLFACSLGWVIVAGFANLTLSVFVLLS
jgi:hypothetical protein